MSEEGMFRLSYPVTAKDYQEAILFQIKLGQQTFYSRLRYYGGSWGLLLLCIYFAVSRPQYSAAARFLPLAAAVILVAVTSYFRFALKSRSARMLARLERNNSFEKGYLGTHTLSVDKREVTLHYGNTNKKIPLANVSQMYTLDQVTLLIADAAIFDLIPNEALDKDGNREGLVEALRSANSTAQKKAIDRKKEEIEQENPRVLVTAAADPERAAQGKAAGYRWFYSTMGAWKGHPTICAFILLYGLFTFFTGMQQTIGILFIILGIYLNRQMLSAFTPLGIQAARRLVAQSQDDLMVDFYYTTPKELVSVVCGEDIRCLKADVTAKRKSRHYLLFYTKDKNMVVIPRSVLTKDQETQFYNLK